MEQFTKIY